MLEISEGLKAPPSRIESILMPPKYAKKLGENGQLVDDINKPTHGKFRVDGKVAGKHYEIAPSRDSNKMRVFDDAHQIETSKGKMPLSDFLLKNVRGLTQLAIAEGFVTVADADLKVQEEHPLAFLKNKNGELVIPKNLSAEQTQNLMLLIFEKTKNTTDFAERDNKTGLTKILLEEIRNRYIKLSEAGKVPNDPKNPSGIFTEEPVFEALNIACRKAVEARLEELAYRKTKVFERKGESKGQRLLNRLSIASGINDESAGGTARKQMESLMGVFKDKIVDRDGNVDVDKVMKILDKELLDEPRDKKGKIINDQKVRDTLQKIMTDPEYRRGGLEFSVQIDLFKAQAFDVLVPAENRLGMKKLQMQIESTSDYREKANLMETLSKERQMWRMAILNHFQVERTLPGKTKIPTIADEIRNPKIFTWDERMKIENDYTNAISKSISTLEKSREDLGGFGELDLSAANLIMTEQLLEEVLPKSAGKPDVRAKKVEKALEELFANCSQMVKEGDSGILKKDTEKRNKYIRDTGLLEGLQGEQKELAKRVIEDAFATQLSLEFKLKKESERIGAPTKPTDVKFGSEINRALKGIELLYRRGVSGVIPEGKRFDLPDRKGKPSYKMIKDDYDVKHIQSTKEAITDEDYEDIVAAMSQTPVAKKEPASVSGAPIPTGEGDGVENKSGQEFEFFNGLSTQEKIVATYMQAAGGIISKARELGVSSNLDQAIESVLIQRKDELVKMGLIEEVVEDNKIKVKIKGKEIKNIIIPTEHDFSERLKQSQLRATNEEKLLMLDLINAIKIGESANLINNETEISKQEEFLGEVADNLQLFRFSKVSNVLGLSEDIWSGNQLLDAMKKDENIKIGRNEKIILEELSISGIDDLDILSTLSELLPANKIFIETLNLTIDQAGELEANPIRNFNINTLVLTATEDGSEVNLSLIDGSCGIIEIKQGQFNIFTNTVPEMISMADGDAEKASRLILTADSLAEVLSREGDDRTDFLMGENSTIQIEMKGDPTNEVIYQEANLHKKTDGTLGDFILIKETDGYKLVLKPEEDGEVKKKVVASPSPTSSVESASSATVIPSSESKGKTSGGIESVHPRLKYKKLSEVTDEFEKQMDLIGKSTKGDGRAVLSGLYTQVFSEGSGNLTRINKGIENFNEVYGKNIDQMMEKALAMPSHPEAILSFCDYVTTYSKKNPGNLAAKEFSINLLERIYNNKLRDRIIVSTPMGQELRKQFGLRFIDLAVVYSRKEDLGVKEMTRLKDVIRNIGVGNLFYESHSATETKSGRRTTMLTEVFNNESAEAQEFLQKAFENQSGEKDVFGFVALGLESFKYHIELPSESIENRYLLVPDEEGGKVERPQPAAPSPTSTTLPTSTPDPTAAANPKPAEEQATRLKTELDKAEDGHLDDTLRLFNPDKQLNESELEQGRAAIREEMRKNSRAAAEESDESAASRTQGLEAVLEKARREAAVNPRDPKTAGQILKETSSRTEASMSMPVKKESKSVPEVRRAFADQLAMEIDKQGEYGKKIASELVNQIGILFGTHKDKGINEKDFIEFLDQKIDVGGSEKIDNQVAINYVFAGLRSVAAQRDLDRTPGRALYLLKEYLSIYASAEGQPDNKAVKDFSAFLFSHALKLADRPQGVILGATENWDDNNEFHTRSRVMLTNFVVNMADIYSTRGEIKRTSGDEPLNSSETFNSFRNQINLRKLITGRLDGHVLPLMLNLLNSDNNQAFMDRLAKADNPSEFYLMLKVSLTKLGYEIEPDAKGKNKIALKVESNKTPKVDLHKDESPEEPLSEASQVATQSAKVDQLREEFPAELIEFSLQGDNDREKVRDLRKLDFTKRKNPLGKITTEAQSAKQVNELLDNKLLMSANLALLGKEFDGVGIDIVPITLIADYVLKQVGENPKNPYIRDMAFHLMVTMNSAFSEPRFNNNVTQEQRRDYLKKIIELNEAFLGKKPNKVELAATFAAKGNEYKFNEGSESKYSHEGNFVTGILDGKDFRPGALEALNDPKSAEFLSNIANALPGEKNQAFFYYLRIDITSAGYKIVEDEGTLKVVKSVMSEVDTQPAEKRIEAEKQKTRENLLREGFPSDLIELALDQTDYPKFIAGLRDFNFSDSSRNELATKLKKMDVQQREIYLFSGEVGSNAFSSEAADLTHDKLDWKKTPHEVIREARPEVFVSLAKYVLKQASENPKNQLAQEMAFHFFYVLPIDTENLRSDLKKEITETSIDLFTTFLKNHKRPALAISDPYLTELNSSIYMDKLLSVTRFSGLLIDKDGKLRQEAIETLNSRPEFLKMIAEAEPKKQRFFSEIREKIEDKKTGVEIVSKPEGGYELRLTEATQISNVLGKLEKDQIN